VTITYGWRAGFTDAELGALHAGGFGGTGGGGWWRRVNRHSLGWVCARDGDDRLVGFVNVAWDGGAHAFVLDTVVAVAARRLGVGTGLVGVAVREACAAGCDWLHVDFEEHLTGFYLESCGFRPTPAGLIAL
jgi:GNAT superfamily N-acetyltransferase